VIIILGPDHTGKTTLARKLGLPYYHFDKDSSYLDYLKPLVELKLFDAVLDRHAVCEYAYAKVMGRKFRFTLKEWHNLLLLTLIQNPLVVLATHKPSPYNYPSDQYLPYDKWDECLSYYREFLNTHHIPHIEYDFTSGAWDSDKYIATWLSLEKHFRHNMDWWVPMWLAGYGCIGSTNPKVLLVAERIGPNNVNNLPFETGPTGRMLSDMLSATGTSFNKVAITNMVKSYRRDRRPPTEEDRAQLCKERLHLKPQRVEFMGTPARYGMKVAKDLGIERRTIVHLGSLNYKGVTDMTQYHDEWKKIMGIVRTVPLRRIE